MFCWLHTRRSFIDFNDLMITILIFSPFYFQSFHFPSGLPFERELPLFVIISLAVSLPSVQSLSFLDKSIPCPLYKYLIFQAEQVALPVCQVGSKVSKVASNQGRGRRRNWVTRRVKHQSIRKIANTSLFFPHCLARNHFSHPVNICILQQTVKFL